MSSPNDVAEEVTIEEQPTGSFVEVERDEEKPGSPLDEFLCDGSINAPTVTFIDFCEAIDPTLEEDVKYRVWCFYEWITSAVTLTGPEMPWIAASFFATQHLKKKVRDMPKFRYTLCEVLDAGKLSVIDLFDRLNRIAPIFGGIVTTKLMTLSRRLQNTLSVSVTIFRKFLKIFRFVFARPESQTVDALQPRVFRMIWYLYLMTRKQLPAGSSSDLLICFDALLCCFDLVVRDLDCFDLQHTFTQEFVQGSSGEGEQILSCLCAQFDGAALDAKHFKVHVFEKIIYEKMNLQWPLNIIDNGDNYIGDFDVAYDQQLRQKGEFDERLFLPEHFEIIYDADYDAAPLEMLRRAELSDWSIDTNLLVRVSTQACLERVEKMKLKPHVAQGNVIQKYVMASDQFCPRMGNELPTFTAKVLEALIPRGWTLEGSQLMSCFAEYEDDPMPIIKDSVRTLTNKFSKRVAQEKNKSTDGIPDPEITSNLAMHRALVEELFYHLLERIIVAEREKMAAYKEADLSLIARKQEFIASLFAVTLELVLAANKSTRKFPWALEALGLPAIHFYKIIEVVVRSEPALSREMARHLNRIEESVFEELAWSFESPLWNHLAQRADAIPSCNTVWAGEMRSEFYSPAKRMRTEEDGVPSSKAMNNFFRKLYFIASNRLVDICERLNLNEQAKSRVWTLFEYILKTETNLLAGRHLDQNLMCAVYIIGKVLNLEITFNKIMETYRSLPSAQERVFRYVTVETEVPLDDVLSQFLVKPNEALMHAIETRQSIVNSEKVNIIEYYNRVFWPRVDNFVRRMDDPQFSVRRQPMPMLRQYNVTPLKKMITDRISVQTVQPGPKKTTKITYRPVGRGGGAAVRTLTRQFVGEQRPPMRRVLPATGNAAGAGGGGARPVDGHHEYVLCPCCDHSFFLFPSRSEDF
ncbi:unnamed protein product, partial [Mesorhabditis spiculigera]